MNLAIDGRALVGNRTGIGVHTAEITRRLNIQPPPLIATHREITDRHGVEHCRFEVSPAPFGVWWQLFSFPRVAESADVVWGPHGTLPPALDVPAVVSVHDLTSITTPHQHRLKTVASFNLMIRRSLDQARCIAAVSRTTADEILRGFAIDPEKVFVVPNGVDEFFKPNPEPGTRNPEPYVLFVGTFEPRKGINDLFEAWQSLDRGSRPRLVIAGDKGWHQRRLRATLQRESDVTIRGYVTPAELRDLYREALLFVYPSRYEGFGLPPLEAMACGTPVIASRAGAIPEICGDAALLVERANPAELRRAMTRVIFDEGLRREMRDRGLGRAAGFRWERSAALMHDLLIRAVR